ncbi:MAG: methyltransferase domain-containing protein [Acidobacteriota bacterium]
MGLKQLYHAVVPESVRYPIGRYRRDAIDRWIRWREPTPLPPRHLLQSVQMTPWVWEFLDVGRASALAVQRELQAGGLAPDATHRVLDFGCGLGRTLRFLSHLPWHLAGCDVDTRSIDWLRRAMPDLEILPNEKDPPLPWPDGAFDGVFAISVFTHFDAGQQRQWAREIARVLRPGGAAAVSTMGPHAFGGFPNLSTPENEHQLTEEGFLFHPGGEAFNARGAFHTREGVEEVFRPHLDLILWTSGGVDGFQDLSLLVKPPSP